jgi:hypothetical protein
MARTGIPGVHVSFVVPWALGKKAQRGYIFKTGAPWTKNVSALSLFQLRQCLKLAEAATAQYGTRGKLPYKGVSMPAVAVKIAPKITGSVGGMSRADRAKARHEATSARIDALRALIAAKSVIAAGPG